MLGNTIRLFSDLSKLSDSGSDFSQTSTTLAIIRTAASLAAFIAGSLFFGFLHRYCRSHRWTHMLDFAIQAGFCTIAATLGTLQIGIPITDPILRLLGVGLRPGLELVHITLLAFQGAASVVLSRVHVMTELPTNVISSHYVDLVSGLPFARCSKQEKPNQGWFSRNRRWCCKLVAILLLVTGAAVGGAVSYHVAIWIVVGIKSSMVLVFWWWEWTQV